MADLRETIEVRINALVNGVPQFKAFSDTLSRIKTQGSTRVNVDTTNAETGMKKLVNVFQAITSASVIAQGPLGGVAGRVRAIGTEAAELTGLLGPVGLLITGIGLAATGASLGILALAKHAATYGEEIFQAREKTGLAAETLSVLKVISRETGTDFNSLTNSAARLQVAISKGITQPSGEAGRALKLLGLQNEAFKRSTPDEQLFKTAKGLQELTNQGDKSRASQALLGRAWLESASAIKEIGTQSEEAKKKADAFGLILSQQDVEAAHRFDVAMKDLSLAVEGFGIQVGQRTIPAVAAALSELGRALGLNESNWKSWGQFIGDVLSQVVVATAAAVAAINQSMANIKTDWNTGTAQLGRIGRYGVGLGSPITSGPSISGLYDEFFGVAPDPYGFRKEKTPEQAADEEATRMQKLMDRYRNLLGTAGGGAGAGKFGGGAKRGGGGAKRGGGGEPVDTLGALLGVDKANADAVFNLFKDQIDRQEKALKQSYDDRKISIKDFYAQELELQTRTIDAEIEKIGKLRLAEQQHLADELAKIQAEKDSGKLTSAQAEAKVTKETLTTQEHLVKLNERLTILYRDRKQAVTDTGTKEKADTDALNASLQKQIDMLDRLQGKGPTLDAREKIAAIDQLIQQSRLEADAAAAAGDAVAASAVNGWLKWLEMLREIIGSLGQISQNIQRIQNEDATLQAQIQLLEAKGQRNLLAEFALRKQIHALVQQRIAKLKELIAEEEKANALIQDPATIQKIIQQKTEIENLKNSYKTLGQTIKDTFIDSAARGLETLFTSIGDVIAGTQKLGDVFRNIALDIIKSLEEVIAKILVMKILMAVFGALGVGIPGLPTGGGGGPGPFGGGGFAAGDFFPAAPGGRIIRVAEGGHDEVVLSTDPRYRNRTNQLLAQFLQRIGALRDFASGGWSLADRIPRFEVGDWALATPGSGAGAQGPVYQTIQMNFPNVRDHSGFKLNQAAIERDLMRAARSGAERFRK